MARCEKCWKDAYNRNITNPKSKAEHYANLIEERKENQCSPEEQAGYDAEICPKCDRKTIHQIIAQCIVCGYEKPKNY